jgi:predicted AAA+ superfamily ATPase
MTENTIEALNRKLDRLIETIARLSPPAPPRTDLASADCFVWQADPG